MALDKVESVQKATESINKQEIVGPAHDVERLPPNKEHFQSLLEPSNSNKLSFQATSRALDTEDVHQTDTITHFDKEDVSAQKSGTATDQDQKKRQNQPEEEGIESVSKTSQKKETPSSSLMNEVEKLNASGSTTAGISPEGVKKQVQETITQIDRVKTQLAQTKTEIKPSYQNLMRNRLSHIDDNLKIALSKAGGEYTPPPVQQTGTSNNPIERFINQLTNSEQQLTNVSQMLEGLRSQGNQASPADMLIIQIKLGHVQQQIELFTNLLNKALESTKTIMNVQV